MKEKLLSTGYPPDYQTLGLKLPAASVGTYLRRSRINATLHAIRWSP